MLNPQPQDTNAPNVELDTALADLSAAKDSWARTSIADRIALLTRIKDQLLPVAKDWAETAGRMKGIPEGSALVGEEWISGPYTVMSACNGLLQTLSHMEGKTFLNSLKKRETASGQTAVRVLPHSIWDHLLLSGVSAEVWMEKGVTADNLAQHTAQAYDTPQVSVRERLR